MSNYNTPVNPFKKGNQHYKKVIATGRPKKYDTPEKLWRAASDYFAWCQGTPIQNLVFRRGKLVTVYKVRELSVKQLCAALEICNLSYYKTLPGYARTVTRIQYVVYEYNFIYAAAGLLKGRSVGHAIRKPRKEKSTRKYSHTYVAPILWRESGIGSAPCRSKIPLPPLIATLQKTYVDTRKVRITKNINKPAEIHKAINYGRKASRKRAIERRKVRIKPLLKTPLQPHAHRSYHPEISTNVILGTAAGNEKYRVERRKVRMLAPAFNRFRPPGYNPQ